MSTYPNIIAAKDARIAELEAEHARLTKELDAWKIRAGREFAKSCELADRALAAEASLSRTGAVKDAEAARDALRELANAKMDLSIEDWCRISNTILSALEPAAPEGEQEHEHIEVTDAGLIQFAEWFRKNYPGPDTIIHKPDWHAPKIYRAARHAFRQQEPEGRQEAVAWMDDGTLRAGSERTAHRVVTDEQKRDMPNAVRTSFNIPLYTRPAEQAVTEAMVEAAARIITKWLGYAWDGLHDGRVTDKGFPVFIHHSQTGWKFQGHKGDMIDLARAALKAAMEAGHG